MVPNGFEIVEFVAENGRSPFRGWFDDLDISAATRVANALSRLGQGNLSEVKGVGGGVLERRIDFGPGYRIYFGRDGERLIVLLAGGTKVRQPRDIEEAQARWRDYKTRKRSEA
jgi:putative addiction module killer protein